MLSYKILYLNNTVFAYSNKLDIITQIDGNAVLVPSSYNGIKVFGYIHLMNAKKYSLNFIKQVLLGTEYVATFGSNRFTLVAYDNGIIVYSTDNDVKSWFKDGIAYSFVFTATYK